MHFQFKNQFSLKFGFSTRSTEEAEDKLSKAKSTALFPKNVFVAQNLITSKWLYKYYTFQFFCNFD